MTPDDLGATPAPPGRIVPNDVRLAIAHMRGNVAGRVTSAGLARAAGVTARTLHRHFVAFLGDPPLVHFRKMRLAAARAALLAADGGVTDIAARFGFMHFGRFSADYRRQFGELPSTTRVRRVAPLASPIHRRLPPTLVVLPLRSSTMEDRLFAESLAEHLAATLARAHGFSVRAASRATGERYGLGGCVTRAGEGRVRVVLRLTDLAENEAHLWGDAFEGDARDLPALHDRIVQAVARAIRPGIEEAEIEAARRKPAVGLLARDLVLRAMPLVLAADPTSAARALAMLEDAIALDPDDPAPVALAGWCRTQFVLYHANADIPGEVARARHLADRAAALDPLGDPLVLTARGCIAMGARWPDEAEALLARASAIDPDFGWAWERRAWMGANFGKPVAALMLFKRAIALKGPRAPMASCFAGIGSAMRDVGRPDKAAGWIRRAIAQNPGAAWFNRLLAPSLLMLGERQAARASLTRFLEAYPGITQSLIIAAHPRPSHCFGPLEKGLASLGLPR
jgi:AraC-like DNA-binding protein/tetratricopeptide (TPR) repeat protein